MKRNIFHRRIASLGILAAAIALALPTAASAQRGAGGGARGAGMFNNPGIRLWTLMDEDLEDLTKQLSLTEAQTLLVTALVTDFGEKNEDGLASYNKMREDMRSRMGGGGGGGGIREAMQGMRQQMDTMMQELGPVFEKLHTDVTELLDEEQVKKMGELLQPRRPGG